MEVASVSLDLLGRATSRQDTRHPSAKANAHSNPIRDTGRPLGEVKVSTAILPAIGWCAGSGRKIVVDAAGRI